MQREQLIRRANVIFRDHGFTIDQLANSGIVVSELPIRGISRGYRMMFTSLTAAFDRLCPIIADKDFTARMVALFKLAEAT